MTLCCWNLPKGYNTDKLNIEKSKRKHVWQRMLEFKYSDVAIKSVLVSFSAFE
jgi:hypothetical protein